MSIKITGLADIVRRHATDRPDAAALVHAGHKTTYAQLDRAAGRVANGLIADGIKPQARVAHLDKSSDIFFELLFGVAKANAVMVSVNWRLAAPEVLHIVNDAKAEILFVGEEFFPVVEKISDELKTVRKIVAFGRAEARLQCHPHQPAAGLAQPDRIARQRHRLRARRTHGAPREIPPVRSRPGAKSGTHCRRRRAEDG